MEQNRLNYFSLEKPPVQNRQNYLSLGKPPVQNRLNYLSLGKPPVQNRQNYLSLARKAPCTEQTELLVSSASSTSVLKLLKYRFSVLLPRHISQAFLAENELSAAAVAATAAADAAADAAAAGGHAACRVSGRAARTSSKPGRYRLAGRHSDAHRWD